MQLLLVVVSCQELLLLRMKQPNHIPLEARKEEEKKEKKED